MDVQRAVDRRRLEAQGVIFGTLGLTRVRSRPQGLGKARLASELARQAQRCRCYGRMRRRRAQMLRFVARTVPSWVSGPFVQTCFNSRALDPCSLSLRSPLSSSPRQQRTCCDIEPLANRSPSAHVLAVVLPRVEIVRSGRVVDAVMLVVRGVCLAAVAGVSVTL